MEKEVADEVANYLAFSAKLSPERLPRTSVLLAALRAKNFVRILDGHERFDTGNLLAEDKSSGVHTGWWISNGTKLATLRDEVALLDCSHWELFKKLEEGEWQLKIVRKRSHLPPPYVHGVEGVQKRWCVLFDKAGRDTGHSLFFISGGRGIGIVSVV